MTRVLSAREASIFACLCDTVLAPAPPLPPVAESDAVEAFDDWLARSPAVNRLAIRAALLALEAAPRLTAPRGGRWRTRPPQERLALLADVERHGGRALVDALRSAAAMSYYGDPRVAAAVGYDPRPLRP